MKQGLFRAKDRVQRLKDYASTPEVFRTAKVQELYRRLRVIFHFLVQYLQVRSSLLGNITTLQSSR